MSTIDTQQLAAELAPLLSPAVPPLLDAKQAAGLLNVPPSWILAEARAERIPAVRLGKYVRFNRDDLLTWLDGRTVGPRKSKR